MTATASTDVTRRHRPAGYRWPPVRAFDAFAGAVPGGRPRLGTAAELIDAARRRTGLDDFGGDEYRAGLEVLVSALQDEADLTPSGRWFARGAIVAALENRLRAAPLLNATITDSTRAGDDVGPALVVVGLPRSGTTLLQHLLALDPDHRSLWQWEAASPAPPAGGGSDVADPRLAAAERSTWLLDRLAPSARVLHPGGADQPTECVTLFCNSFASLELGVINHVPSYVRWCLDTDMTPHYDYYARQLRMIGRDGRPRWALKSPAHLFWMRELTTALPQSRVVMVHRDPVQVLASFCGLVAVLSGIGARRIDRQAIGRLWPAVWAEGVRRADAARAHVPPDRWQDLRYDDLVADPVASVAAVYDRAGLELPPGMPDRIRRHMTRNPQVRDPRFRFELAEFGLDARTVRSLFEASGRDAWV